MAVQPEIVNTASRCCLSWLVTRGGIDTWMPVRAARKALFRVVRSQWPAAMGAGSAGMARSANQIGLIHPSGDHSEKCQVTVQKQGPEDEHKRGKEDRHTQRHLTALRNSIRIPRRTHWVEDRQPRWPPTPQGRRLHIHPEASNQGCHPTEHPGHQDLAAQQREHATHHGKSHDRLSHPVPIALGHDKSAIDVYCLPGAGVIRIAPRTRAARISRSDRIICMPRRACRVVPV
jgi:hypothetical protein